MLCLLPLVTISDLLRALPFAAGFGEAFQKHQSLEIQSVTCYVNNDGL